MTNALSAINQSDTTAILVENLSKKFDLHYRRTDSSLKGIFITFGRRILRALGLLKSSEGTVTPDGDLSPEKSAHSQITVLNSINLRIGRGETVAFVGRNGSGKSTLLKLLAGIYEPTTGTVNVQGRISPLIELGAGFHPEFTGRENILLNAQILGLSRRDVLERIDEIIEFSELGDFIDYPVRTYSSGMFMRLAFSVAVKVDPDILLVDEILAVGDARFQAKCHSKLEEFKKRGKTIILVTHSLGIVESWATRAVYLRDGTIAFDGNPSQAIAQYLAEEGASQTQLGNPSQDADADGFLWDQTMTAAAGWAVLDRVECQEKIQCHSVDLTPDGRFLCSFSPRDDFDVGKYQFFTVRLFNQDRTLLVAESRTPLVPSNEAKISLVLEGISSLVQGRFFMHIFAESIENSQELLRVNLRILGLQTTSGLLRLPLTIGAEMPT